MSTSVHWASRILRKLWLFVAIVMVLCAVLLSALRLALPYLNDFRHDISHVISDEFNIPIKFGAIDAGWQGMGPSLTLKMVSFEDDDHNTPLQLQIEALKIEVDFWRSIVSHELVANNFVLEGINAEIDLKKLKVKSPDQQSDKNLLETLKPLFLKHFKRFDVQESRLILANGKAEKRIINIDQLSWYNRGEHHQGVGEFSISALDNQSIKFILDLHDQKAGLSGQMYVNSQGLNLANFYDFDLRDDIVELSSQVPFEAWLDISAGIPTQMLARLQPSHVSWKSESQVNPQVLHLSDAILTANFSDTIDTWQLKELTIQHNANPKTTVNLNVKHNLKSSLVKIDSFNIKPLLAFTKLFKVDPLVHNLAEQLNPNTEIHQLSLHKNKQGWRGFLQLDNVGWQAVSPLPELNHWQADIAFNQSLIAAHIYTQQGELGLPELFDKPFEIEQANLNLNVSLQDAWSVSIYDTQVKTAGNTFNASAFVSSDEQGEVQMQLFTEVDKVEALNLEKFLPRKAMGQFVYDYVLSAFKQGYADFAQVVWQGRFNDFPFDNKQGLFHAHISVEEAAFQFQADWPTATELALNLDFINQNLLFNSQKANLLDLSLQQLSAKIDNVYNKDATLYLNANVKGSGLAATDVIQQSMLAKTVGKALTELSVKGDILANLNLTVPLNNADETHAKGSILLANNQVNINPTGFELNQVSGELHFDMDKLSAENVTFEFANAPMQASVNASQEKDAYKVAIDLQGLWEAPVLFDSWSLPYLASTMEGEINWQGLLQLNFPAQGFTYDFSADVDLAALALDLPRPYHKQVGEVQRLTLTANGDIESSLIHGHMSDLISFDGVLPHETASFSRAYLVLGEQQLGVPGQGFNIAVHLPDIVLDDYITFVNGLVSDLGKSTSDSVPILGKPQRIRGDLAQVKIANMEWHDTFFDVQATDSLWLTRVNAREFRGDIKIDEDWFGRGVEINAEYFNYKLPKQNKQDLELTAEAISWLEKTEKNQAERIFANLPPLQITCLRCELNDKPLGEIRARLTRASDRILINSLDLKQSGNQISATGYWQLVNQQHKTQLKGDVKSNDVGSWLRQFEYASPVRDSNLQLNFDLAWQNAPHLYSHGLLNGNVKWSLGEGYFTEVSDQGARLFSLLSMDSLVRKLRLDFRDVFSKGLFFNDMKGTVSVKNGISKTDDAHMNGVAGNMDIVGSSDLAKQTLNYRISFSPKLTSSLPILVAWMVNPVTGVAALALDKVLESAQVVSKIEFDVNGTFDKPIVQEVGRSSKEVQLSNKPKKGQSKGKQPDKATQPRTGPVIPMVEPQQNTPVQPLEQTVESKGTGTRS
ncbi:YhdP family protein [Algibacillus agarilyticus]|uniref:YhdP family protein n=1 Tax=Algibacillus agarilyticus TaxID=2234133 RepID=UPI000DD04985|nr:YhdP family protein [Algibacillus agarilyticus]